jgi:hypothetical protein
MACCFKVQGWRRPFHGVRTIAAVGSPALTPAIIGNGGCFALGRAAVAGCLQSKEARPTPGRAGDGACDR